MVEQASAAILAGGSGTRLGGVRKAFLMIEGRPIIERQLEVLRPLFSELIIVANEPEPFEGLGGRVIADLLPGRGAPGGVYSALVASQAPWVFCLACDMPFVAAGPIARLSARRSSSDAVAPSRAGLPEPLFAFYSRRCLPAFEKLLVGGTPSLIRLLLSVQAALVDEAELRDGDPEGRAFENLNTPEDLARLACITRGR